MATKNLRIQPFVSQRKKDCFGTEISNAHVKIYILIKIIFFKAIRNYCPKIENGEWGSVSDGDRIVGTSLIYHCAQNYFEPEVTAICLSFEKLIGEWQPKNSTSCVKKVFEGCDSIMSSHWGSAKPDRIETNDMEGAKLIFSCATGYEQPDNPAECVLKGSILIWEGDMTCKS